MYVIRNARLDPDWQEVKRRTLVIVGRSVSSLIKTQGIGDLSHIYLITQRDGVDFNLAYIPSEFTTKPKSPFDTTYMRALYEVGRSEAVSGSEWKKHPPGYAPDEAIDIE
jgi:hypothetical protein